jgi:hypothetical protein
MLIITMKYYGKKPATKAETSSRCARELDVLRHPIFVLEIRTDRSPSFASRYEPWTTYGCSVYRGPYDVCLVLWKSDKVRLACSNIRFPIRPTMDNQCVIPVALQGCCN